MNEKALLSTQRRDHADAPSNDDRRLTRVHTINTRATYTAHARTRNTPRRACSCYYSTGTTPRYC